jgi:hypothetical protein
MYNYLGVLTLLHLGTNLFIICVLRHLYKCCSVQRRTATLLRWFKWFLILTSIKFVIFYSYLGEKCLFLYSIYISSTYWVRTTGPSSFNDCTGSYKRINTTWLLRRSCTPKRNWVFQLLFNTLFKTLEGLVIPLGVVGRMQQSCQIWYTAHAISAWSLYQMRQWISIAIVLVVTT